MPYSSASAFSNILMVSGGVITHSSALKRYHEKRVRPPPLLRRTTMIPQGGGLDNILAPPTERWKIMPSHCSLLCLFCLVAPGPSICPYSLRILTPLTVDLHTSYLVHHLRSINGELFCYFGLYLSRNYHPRCPINTTTTSYCCGVVYQVPDILIMY